jgi:hypothetical protein
LQFERSLECFCGLEHPRVGLDLAEGDALVFGLEHAVDEVEEGTGEWLALGRCISPCVLSRENCLF